MHRLIKYVKTTLGVGRATASLSQYPGILQGGFHIVSQVIKSLLSEREVFSVDWIEM